MGWRFDRGQARKGGEAEQHAHMHMHTHTHTHTRIHTHTHTHAPTSDSCDRVTSPVALHSPRTKTVRTRCEREDSAFIAVACTQLCVCVCVCVCAAGCVHVI